MYVSVYLHMHVHTSITLDSYFFETGSLTNPESHHFSEASWLTSDGLCPSPPANYGLTAHRYACFYMSAGELAQVLLLS